MLGGWYKQEDRSLFGAQLDQVLDQVISTQPRFSLPDRGRAGSTEIHGKQRKKLAQESASERDLASTQPTGSRDSGPLYALCWVRRRAGRATWPVLAPRATWTPIPGFSE